jgi:hypothetical protein
MEKSIESIWKEGFLKNDALITPKLNNLYKQKSIDIVEKFKRMYKVNIIALMAFALLMLVIAIPSGMPYMALPMFFLFCGIVTIALKFKKKLENLDKSQNSYEYLKSFDNWTKEMIQTNTSLSRFMYPYVFLVMIAGFWFGSFGGDVPGNTMINEYLVNNPETLTVFGVPLFGLIGLVFILAVISYFGAAIGNFDLNIVYGRILDKMDGLLLDMEDLRK